MAFEKFKGAATRKAVGATVDGVLKYVNKDRVKGLNRLVDISEYLVGDLYPDAVFDGARRMIADPDNKWMKYVNSMLDDLDPHVVKTHILNIGYQAGFYGYAKTNRFEEEHGYRIPWIILMDPTSACNKHCIGCWSAEYGNRLNLSYEDLASIVRQGEELGIYFYMMTGGEPLVRKDDIIRLAREFPKSMFYAFTNGSLITDEFAETMRELGNISLALSIEGFEGDNDARRGEGSFQEVVKAMEILKNHGLVFGTSICYTSKNYKMVTSDEFLDFLIDHGVRYNWYFHYMPVGNDAAPELMPSPEQREQMYRRIRDYRRSKPLCRGALQAAASTATSTPTAMWNPVCSFTTPMRTSTTRHSWSASPSRSSRSTRNTSPSTATTCSPVPCWKTPRSWERSFTTSMP